MMGSGDNEGIGRMSMISSLPLQVQSITNEMPSTSVSLQKDDRVPQWSQQETKDFIAIRAELERDFTVTKRNKNLWEIVAARMKQRGYRRSPDQCKCKWKNLVNRYKGKETSDPENGRQCPFFEELHAVFVERETSMQRTLLESEAGNVQAKKKVKKLSGGDRSSDDILEEEEEDEDESEEERVTRSGNSRKRKAEKHLQQQQQQRTDRSVRNNGGSIQEMLQDFFNQQQRMELQWRETMEKRAQERRLLEQEWRKSMENLERERLLMEQAWREREEQRRIREERRGEERDALLTSLLNKLLHENF